VLVEKFFRFFLRLWLREEETLAVVAAQISENGELTLGLDAFGDHTHPQTLCEGNDRLKNLRIFTLLSDRIDERTVDL